MKRQLLLSLTLAALVSGCAGGKNSFTSAAQYNSAREKVLEADRAAAPSATNRRIVETKVLTSPRVEARALESMPPPTPASGFQGYANPLPPSPMAGTATYSEYMERWTVQRDGEMAYYRVTYRPGSANRGEIEVSPDK